MGENLVQCWGCGERWHADCVRNPPHCKGPWFCKQCLTTLRRAGTRDLLLDFELMKFLATGSVPDDRDARQRVIQAGGFVKM